MLALKIVKSVFNNISIGVKYADGLVLARDPDKGDEERGISTPLSATV